MPDLSYDPIQAPADVDGFVQTIRLYAAGRTLGHARWHTTGDGHDGVFQLLELTVAPERRRQHYGKQLFEAFLEQIRKFCKARKIKPRRIWINVQQKEQVVGRAFLTLKGFHHVATIPALLKGQDAMIYLMSLD